MDWLSVLKSNVLVRRPSCALRGKVLPFAALIATSAAAQPLKLSRSERNEPPSFPTHGPRYKSKSAEL
jgi:hypothetical protein